MARKHNNNQFICHNIGELRAAFHEIKSTVAGDTKFMAQALLFIAEQAVAAKPSPKKPRKLSKWNQFFAEGMKAGKSPSQIAAEWKSRK